MTKESTGDITDALSTFVARTRWEDIPETVRKEAARSIFNGFGTALGGAGDPGIRRMVAALLPFAGAPTSTLVGQERRADMLTACFVNAASTNVFDFDDTHEGTILHPTAPVAPPLFALAEQEPISGRRILSAFALGVEIECRLANAVSPGHYRRGWHITSTCGVFGAAAAAGKLLGLDAEGLRNALGIASAQSSGLVETLGTMAKSVGVGASARGGLLAALMAKEGVEGPARPLEGSLGFLRVTSDAPDMAPILSDLGEKWELCRNMYKPYPCGVVLNPVIDACLSLLDEDGIDPRAIESVTVTGNPLLKERTDRPDPRTGRQAQVSAQHAIAVVLLRGAAGVAEFGDDAVGDPDVAALRARVRPVAVDETMPVESIVMQVSLRDGGMRTRRVDTPSGGLERPLTDEELERKFTALAAHGCPGLDPAPLIAALWSLAETEDAGTVMRLARP